MRKALCAVGLICLVCVGFIPIHMFQQKCEKLDADMKAARRVQIKPRIPARPRGVINGEVVFENLPYFHYEKREM